jgi:radical SAM superfamily enzyme YgiQ (UPF0313 family)
MLNYDMPLYRPPSEGRSVIIQATLGCSHNKCSFCAMYRTKRFSIRPFEDIARDIEQAARAVPTATRVFLADGDALVIPTERLLPILELLYKAFPHLERVTSYALPRNLIKKSVDELRRLREAGLTMLYYGIESGDPLMIERITKGGTREEMIEGCGKAHEAGMEVSATVILGLGGKKYSAQHIDNTASILSAIGPAYASALVLTVVPIVADEFYEKYGEPFEPLSVPEILDETARLIAGMDVTKTVFRSNHASNYLPIGGVLNRDREALLQTIAKAKEDQRMLRPEWMRGL